MDRVSIKNAAGVTEIHRKHTGLYNERRQSVSRGKGKSCVVVNACGHSTWGQETKDQEFKGYRRSKPVWLHETLSQSSIQCKPINSVGHDREKMGS